jgi:hypothetical protein
MSDVCQHLHKEVLKRPRFKAGFTIEDIPANGIYILFEHGELAHGAERIVRIGTHTGQSNLATRLNEHLYTKNKDRSIFRKHIGRCLLLKDGDPFFSVWDTDLTTKEARIEQAHLINNEKLKDVENKVSEYINKRFSFVVISIDDKDLRMKSESGLLSAIAQCTECQASHNWLGRYHKNPRLRESGLWNIQGLNKQPISFTQMKEIL